MFNPQSGIARDRLKGGMEGGVGRWGGRGKEEGT